MSECRDRIHRLMMRNKSEEKENAGCSGLWFAGFGAICVPAAAILVLCLCNNLLNSGIKVFVGEAPQFDDITLLCLRYNGKC